MEKRLIVVSGLPGSGKSTLAKQLASALGLALLDKDTFLERLFESKGAGDAEGRKALSRESDLILRTEATISKGAVLVSHWHLPGMPLDSGTPTDWIHELSEKFVHVHCECPVEVAAERFGHRKRHPGHLDSEKSDEEILASIHQLARLGPLKIEPCIDVDTSQTPNLEAVLRDVHSAFLRSDSD
jgi:glucokinase